MNSSLALAAFVWESTALGVLEVILLPLLVVLTSINSY